MKKNSGLEFEEVLFNEGETREQEDLERPASTGIFFFALLIVVAAAGTVLFRISALGIVEGATYGARAEANVHREINTPANRGVIVDRFGEVLAQNRASFSVFADVSKLLKDPAGLEVALRALGEVLKVDSRELVATLGESDFEHTGLVSLVRNITPKEAIEVKALGLSGIEVVDDYEREYVDGEIFSHVIGYTGVAERGNAIVGKTGIEDTYNEVLRGEDGYALGYRDALGNVLETRVVREAQSGQELALTIDAGLQRYFYNRLQVGLEAVKSHAGIGLALNPQTGEVLALVNLPSFDNNVFVSRARNEERARFLADREKPLFNRAISGNYNPGSTIKPLHALAALREGVMQPTETVYSSGVLEIANPYTPSEPSRFLDWKAHGLVDVRSALARSSNIYFYVAGGGVPSGQVMPAHKGLGIERLRSYWLQFGFDKIMGIDLSGERPGFIPSPDEKALRSETPWRLGDTYNISIGQGDLSITPLQLLSMIASVGNGGALMRPYVVPHTGVPETVFAYRDWGEAIEEVRAGMRDAVIKPYGTASLLYDLPMPVSGKTGSAQIENNKSTNAFFVGYAPSDNPEIAILVLVEHAQSGSLNAIPIARDVFNWYYQNRIENVKIKE